MWQASQNAGTPAPGRPSFLANGWWQGLGSIVAVLSLGWAVFAWLKPPPTPSPPPPPGAPSSGASPSSVSEPSSSTAIRPPPASGPASSTGTGKAEPSAEPVGQESQPQGRGAARLSISPTVAQPGQRLTVEGRDLPANVSAVQIQWNLGNYQIVGLTFFQEVETDGRFRFRTESSVPRDWCGLSGDIEAKAVGAGRFTWDPPVASAPFSVRC